MNRRRLALSDDDGINLDVFGFRQRSDRCSPSITSSVHGPPLRKGDFREENTSLFPFLKGGPCTEEVMDGRATPI